jgi:hypothetical protein
MFQRFYRNRYGYSRWDGTQRIEGLDADDILRALSDDYLENGNLQQAMKRLMQDGVRGEDGRRAMGLREMMQRLRNSRSEQLNRYNMASGVMDDLREKLEEIKRMEREGIQRRLDNQSPGTQSPTGNQQQGGQQSQEGNQQPGGQQSQEGKQPQGGQQQGQQGQQSSPGNQSQGGQQGQTGQGEGQSGELSPEQMQKMLEMIAKR